MNNINNEEHPQYGPVLNTGGAAGAGAWLNAKPFISRYSKDVEDDIINKALNILASRLTTKGIIVTCPDDVLNFLTMKMSELEHEVFAVMFLDNNHQLIEYEEMFRGTIDGASVYPREVIKRALQLNAAALIVTHNHPSGVPEPSKADERITIRLKDACKLVDIRLLDHVIVGDMETVSLANRGIL